MKKKAMGWPFYERTAPMSMPDASVSTVKGSLKFGKVRTGAVDRAVLRCSKANCA